MDWSYSKSDRWVPAPTTGKKSNPSGQPSADTVSSRPKACKRPSFWTFLNHTTTTTRSNTVLNWPSTPPLSTGHITNQPAATCSPHLFFFYQIQLIHCIIYSWHQPVHVIPPNIPYSNMGLEVLTGLKSILFFEMPYCSMMNNIMLFVFKVDIL